MPRAWGLGYAPFEAYCQARWGWGRSYAYRLMDAAETVSEMSPRGDIPAPTTEIQVRELTRLPEPTERAAALDAQYFPVG